MVTKTTSQSTNSPEKLDSQTVCAFLEQHKDFFVQNPQALLGLELPTPKSLTTDGGADKVTHLFSFQAKQLQEKLNKQSQRTRQIVETTVQNEKSWQQMHKLTIACLGSSDIDSLLKTLKTSLVGDMGIDYVRLVIRQDMKLTCRIPLTLGRMKVEDITPIFSEVDSESENPCVLRTVYADTPRTMHGPHGADVRSDALIALTTPTGDLLGMLALGSREDDQFHPGQGSALLSYLGQILGHHVSSWVARDELEKVS